MSRIDTYRELLFQVAIGTAASIEKNRQTKIAPDAPVLPRISENIYTFLMISAA